MCLFTTGNSYRDATQYASSISKTGGEAIALSLGGRQLACDQFVSYTGDNVAQLNRSNNGRSPHETALRQQINIEAEPGNEICLNIIPVRSGTTPTITEELLASNLDPVKKPSVNINIDVAGENNCNRRGFSNDSNISVVYNREGNIRIAIAHDATKLKLKRMKRGGAAATTSRRHKLFKFFTFNRTKTMQSVIHERCYGPPVASSSSTANDVQTAPTDGNLITFDDSTRSAYHRPSCKSSLASLRLQRDENELDAYMRELRARKCIEID